MSLVEAGREALDQVDELARHLVAAGGPVHVVGRVLAEDAQQVAVRGRGRRVVAGLDVDLAEADGGLAAVAAPRTRAARRRGRSVRSIVAQRGPGLAGRGGPLGSAVSAALNFTTGLRTFQASSRCAVVARGRRVSMSSARLGSALQRIVAASISVPSSSRTPSPGMISATGTPVASWRAGLARGVGDREADHPHAALDVAPDRALALEVALVVHELDRGGAGILRAAVGGDHALAEQRVLQALVLHVVVEDVGDRRVEDDVEHRLLAVQQILDLLAGRALADPGVAPARAQPAADLVEDVLVGPVALDVLLGDLQLLEVAPASWRRRATGRTTCRPRTAPTGSGRRRSTRSRAAGG